MGGDVDRIKIEDYEKIVLGIVHREILHVAAIVAAAVEEGWSFRTLLYSAVFNLCHAARRIASILGNETMAEDLRRIADWANSLIGAIIKLREKGMFEWVDRRRGEMAREGCGGDC